MRRGAAFIDARVAAHGAQPAARYVLGRLLRSGSTEVVHEGTLATDPTARVSITLTTKHAEAPDRIRERFALQFDGIAPLEYVGAADPGVPYDDALVERLPPGRPAAHFAPVPEVALARLGADIAAVAARVHAAGGAIAGIRPELIYVEDRDDTPRLSGLVPRGVEFCATSPMTRGLRAYHVPYLAPETLATNRTGAAADVFALGATLFFLGTGKHPFGDPEALADLVGRLMTGRAEVWLGSAPLGELIARAMAHDASARPSAAELASALGKLA